MSHDSENWDVLQTLFHLAGETAPENRERVLAAHCSDPEIVRRALALYDGSAPLDDKMPAPVLPSASTRVGPYLLLRPIGSGGIGTVYLAERIVGGAPQRIALKMLAPHAAGQSFIERFHREQHILGSLDHPNITRLIDAGLSDSGQQYLVMEYVDGQHLDTYCDDRKLGVTDRLRLFLDVCDAVAYAHRNLIVHLDLKPSNILVSQDGNVKLLDFGTSKLIQPSVLVTTTIMATPAYSSPEQLRNEPVTTACDVYSLGAVLFELLTGRRPYANSSVAAMIEHAVTGQQPENLLDAISSDGARTRGTTEVRLRQLLAGDLQTITQKCLEPQPLNRYASVDALAQDVRRYLGGDPILARRQTAFYRLGKFVRRHRAGVIVGVSTALLLIGTVSYALWRQQQALREAQRSQRMQTFMHQLFRLANSNYTGKPAVTVPEFLQLGVKILPDYIRNPEDLLQAKVALAESMFDNGDMNDAKDIFEQTATTAKATRNIDAEVESKAFVGHIDFLQGKVSEGEQVTADALDLSRQADVSPTVRVWAEEFYAGDRVNLGLGDHDLELLRDAANEARRNNLPLHERANAIYQLGTALEFFGKLDEAEPLYYEALDIERQDPVDICDPSAVYGDLGYLRFLKNDAAGSVLLLQRSYDGYKTCSGPASRDALSILGYLGGSLVEAGRAPEAVQLLEGSRPYWEKITNGFISLNEFPISLSIAYNATGRYTDAERLVLAMIAAKRAQAPTRVFSRPELILAQALAGEHRYQEALPHADIALRSYRNTNPNITLAPFGYTLKAQAEATDTDIRTHLGLPKLP